MVWVKLHDTENGRAHVVTKSNPTTRLTVACCLHVMGIRGPAPRIARPRQQRHAQHRHRAGDGAAAARAAWHKQSYSTRRCGGGAKPRFAARRRRTVRTEHGSER